MYVLAPNQQVETYPYSIDELKRDNSGISFPKDISEELLGQYNVFPVVVPEQPSYSIFNEKVVWGTPIVINGVWTHQWVVVPLTPEESAEILSSVLGDYDRALNDHFDSVAQTKQYDSKITCALRAGFSGPYQQEGIAFAQWMDSCNESAYQIYAAIASGEMQPFDSEEDFIATFPQMVWPSGNI